MRSLFVKIFVAFFLTVVLLGVLLELTAVRTEMRRVDEVFRPYAERIAPHVADVYEQRGPDAVAAELRRLPVAAVLLDERGQPIGAVPDGLTAAVPVIREWLAGSSEPLSQFVARRNLALQPVQASSGRRYVLALVIPHERWMAILNTLDQYPALRLSVVGLVAGAICLVLARHITRPLVHLRAAASRMADGQLGARVGHAFATRRDEIGALGRDFDLMADRISVLVSSQRRLLADVSHELRSPLARLTVALGLARHHADEGTNALRQPLLTADLDRIEQEVGRLDRLIGQSLTLARIDSGVEAGPHETFDLTNLVQQVAADGEYEARGVGRHVSIAAADACLMSGIHDLVRSAIENVVRNAIRCTAAGTTVDVELRRVTLDGPPTACIHIRDHGLGIPDALLAEVFLPFRRGDAPVGRTTPGAGLGLAIADRVVRMHGGSIRAANALGGGLDVEMTLPLTPTVARGC